MSRAYKILKSNIFQNGNYCLVPIRDEDKYDILKWRNEQIDVLRQQAPLTKEQQENYYKTVVDKLFEVEQPSQLLWSFLDKDELIGYGGLVHIDWENGEAEISFLTETSRNNSEDTFISDWINYLSILKNVAQYHLQFNKIYTYAYDIRPNLYIALEKSGFKETNRLNNFVEIKGKKKDVVIHSLVFSKLKMRKATISDADIYYKWANDELVRKNSFNSHEINYDQHINWFSNKLNSENCFFYLFLNEENIPIGQVRIDKSDADTIIGISIDKNFRGLGLGTEMLIKATRDYQGKYPITIIVAYIKVENISSYKSFLKAGFKQETTEKIQDVESYKLIKKK